MNPLIEILWDSFDMPDVPEDRHLNLVREKLYDQLTAAVSQEFMQKVSDINFEIEDLYAHQVFQRGLCLGGQLMLFMLSEDLNPPVTS